MNEGTDEPLRVFLSQPCWIGYMPVFESEGFEFHSYPYWSDEKQ